MPLVMAQILAWDHSCSEGGKCYCQTTFDHNIGNIIIPGTGGLTGREACAREGQGPNTGPRAFYNDIQCGNGPPNEHPGRNQLSWPCGYWRWEPLWLL